MERASYFLQTLGPITAVGQEGQIRLKMHGDQWVTLKDPQDLQCPSQIFTTSTVCGALSSCSFFNPCVCAPVFSSATQKKKGRMGGWVAGLRGHGGCLHIKRKTWGKDLIRRFWVVGCPMLCCLTCALYRLLGIQVDTRRMRGNKSVLGKLCIEMKRWRPKGPLSFHEQYDHPNQGGCLCVDLWSHGIAYQLVTLSCFCCAVFNTQRVQQWEIALILGTSKVWSTVNYHLYFASRCIAIYHKASLSWTLEGSV